MSVTLRILWLHDEQDDLKRVEDELRQTGLEPHIRQVRTESEFLANLEPPPEVFLATDAVPERQLRSALERLLERKLDLPCFVVSQQGGQGRAVLVRRLGSPADLLQDWPARLGPAVVAALARRSAAEDGKRILAEHTRLIDQVRAGRERAQRLSQQLMAAQEAERRRLARELHDEIGQALTAVKINLQAAQRGSGATTSLAESLAIVDQVLQQVRSLSLDLRPSLLDDLGLVAALRWYVDRQGQRAGFTVDFTALPPGLRAPAHLETACFRVAQEALTNIVKHARAQRVRLDVRQESLELLLQIHDNGAGFDVAAARQRAVRGGSLGLLGMQERVLLLGGRLDVVSAPGQGTDICVRLPLAPAPSLERRSTRRERR